MQAIDPVWNRPLCYDGDGEDHASLATLSSLCSVNEDFAKDVKVPDNVALGWLPVKNQERIGSCGGHSNVGVGQVCHYWSTGKLPDFSELWAYIRAQSRDGLAGRDCGSTANAHIHLATVEGYKTEQEVPYRGQSYPVNWRDIAAIPGNPSLRLKQVVRVKSWQQLRQGLAARWAAMAFGPWFNVPRDGQVWQLQINQAGGHAWYFPGEFRNGNPRGMNSWGIEFADRGRFDFYEQPFNQWLTHPHTYVFLLSELAEAKPRNVDFTKELWK
jgi:hypothetical protein